MILTIANQKGGVGRSTTAVLLSYAFTRAGRNVFLLDVDPVGTSRYWITEVYEDEGHSFQAGFWYQKPGNQRDLDETMSVLRDEQLPDTVFILDAGARNIPGARDAVNAADLVVVPTRPGLTDARETWETLGKLNGPHVVMLTMATPGSPEERECRGAFTMEGAYVLDTVIPHDPAIAKLYGSVPDEGLYGYEELARELDSVMELLGQAVGKRRQQEEWEKTHGGTLFRGIEQRMSSPAYLRST